MDDSNEESEPFHHDENCTHVTTLRDLQRRRDELLHKKQILLTRTRETPSTSHTQPSFTNILNLVEPLLNTMNDSIADAVTLTTIFDPETITVADPPFSTADFPLSAMDLPLSATNPPVSATNLSPSASDPPLSATDPQSLVADPTQPVENTLNKSIMVLLSNDSLIDPPFVPLSEIGNIQSIEPLNIEWFPERETEPQLSKETRTRKKKADHERWKREINKKKRMLGKEYTGYVKENNKYVQKIKKPERSLGQKCNSVLCARSKIIECNQLSEDMRQGIFANFWSLTWEQKKTFVRSMVDKLKIKRPKSGTDSRRSKTQIYYLQTNGKKFRVCLKTFLSTLGIKEWTVRYWIGDSNPKNMPQERSLLITTSSSSVGRTGSIKRDSVISYLNALPKLPSHYCRQSTTKQYLEPMIQSKLQLYTLYVKYATSVSKPVASRKLFCDILDEENISLFQPKKDACDVCCSHKAGNLSDEDFKRHVELKDLARKEKSKDKELAKKGQLHVVAADLQAVKLCPSLNASALYFKTKLAVHNFTVYNLGTNQVLCYWFDETACDLKATTYASFYVDVVTRLINEDRKDVVIWSDGCTAQNRNSIVSNALLRLAVEKNITITQSYLEKGHTQMEVDSVHSVIERKLKNKEIYLPSQYASITREARSKPFPYEVLTVDHTFFKDFSCKTYQVYDSIRPGRSAGDDCVTDLRVLRYNPSGTIDYKIHFNDEFRPLPRRARNISLLSRDIPRLYSARQPILESKYEHLQLLKDVIPKDCHLFYDNIPTKK